MGTTILNALKLETTAPALEFKFSLLDAPYRNIIS